MLKSKFWSGLRDPLLKNLSRYKFDTTKDFDQLRKEIRAIELELGNSDKGITTVQHQPISSDSKKLDDILKKIDRMGKRLDTLERSEKAPEKETSNTIYSIMVGIEVEIGLTLNVMVGVGVIKTIEVMEIKIARTKTNQKQTTKRKLVEISNAGQIRDLRLDAVNRSPTIGKLSQDTVSKPSLLDRMVGRATESIVYVNKIKCMSLLDSGSMVSTISVATLKSMHPPPDIKTLDEFTLSVKVAEGSPLPYLGYVEVSISVTFQSDNMMVLLLVVPETDYNKSVPVVIGTNILRPIKSSVSDSHVKVPHNWDIAFSALDAGVNLVKSTNKRPIKVGPMSVLTVSGICKSKTVLETAVTECVDDTKGTLGVCPRVVSVKSPGKNRIPVRIFNMTTKVVYLKPKSIICGLKEMKVTWMSQMT